MTEPGGNPKLEIDDSWKQQAAAEKAKLSGQPATAAPQREPAATRAPAPSGTAEKTTQPADHDEAPPDAPRQIPPANFELMVEQYVTQVLIALGGIPHPASGKRLRDMDVAKHYIDMLGVLDTKTKGNLTADEDRLLSTALYQMRMHYVNASRTR